MTLALYDNPASSNALKVRFLLAVLGLPYERRTVDLARPRPAEYLALNPVGGIPTLADGDLVLAESHAILRYLAVREGRDDLYPAALRDRARVDEFLDRWSTGLRAAFLRVELPALGYAPAVGLDGVPRDADSARAAEAEIRPQVELVERLVGDGFTVLGRFTIADCAVAPVLFRTTKTGMDLGPFPKLTALRDALMRHSAWAAADPVT